MDATSLPRAFVQNQASRNPYPPKKFPPGSPTPAERRRALIAAHEERERGVKALVHLALPSSTPYRSRSDDSSSSNSKATINNLGQSKNDGRTKEKDIKDPSYSDSDSEYDTASVLSSSTTATNSSRMALLKSRFLSLRLDRRHTNPQAEAQPRSQSRQPQPQIQLPRPSQPQSNLETPPTTKLNTKDQEARVPPAGERQAQYRAERVSTRTLADIWCLK